MTDLSMHGRTCARSSLRHRAATPNATMSAAATGRSPLLDAETETQLIARWRDRGDEQALKRLVTAFQFLVNKIAARYRASGVPMEDLVAEGNVGLMQAIGRFESERGFRLATYAMWWIRAAISDYALNASSLVKVVSTDRQKRVFFALRRMKARLAALEQTRLPEHSLQQLADELAVPEAEVAEIYSWMEGRDLSTNVIAGFDSDGAEEWQDFLVDEADDPETAVITRDEERKRKTLVVAALDTLDERERQIVVSRHLAEEPCKLATLGKRYGVSRERVRQIETRALEKLRRRVHATAVVHGLLDDGD